MNSYKDFFDDMLHERIIEGRDEEVEDARDDFYKLHRDLKEYLIGSDSGKYLWLELEDIVLKMRVLENRNAYFQGFADGMELRDLLKEQVNKEICEDKESK